MRIDAPISQPEGEDYITQLREEAERQHDIIRAEWQRDIIENGPLSKEKERQYMDRMIDVTQKMVDGFIAHNRPKIISQSAREILAKLGNDW